MNDISEKSETFRKQTSAISIADTPRAQTSTCSEINYCTKKKRKVKRQYPHVSTEKPEYCLTQNIKSEKAISFLISETKTNSSIQVNPDASFLSMIPFHHNGSLE